MEGGSDPVSYDNTANQVANKAKRAVWNSEYDEAFYTICVELLHDDRIKPRGPLTDKVLKSISEKFFSKTQQRYQPQQLKYKWDASKKLYDTYCFHVKLESDKVLKKKTKKAAKVYKNLKNGPPAHFDLLEIMFHQSYASPANNEESNNAEAGGSENINYPSFNTTMTPNDGTSSSLPSASHPGHQVPFDVAQLNDVRNEESNNAEVGGSENINYPSFNTTMTPNEGTSSSLPSASHPGQVPFDVAQLNDIRTKMQDNLTQMNNACTMLDNIQTNFNRGIDSVKDMLYRLGENGKSIEDHLSRLQNHPPQK